MIRTLARWWLAPAPAERLAALRIAIGTFALVYVVARIPELAASSQLPAASFAPVGLVRVIAAPLAPWLVLAFAFATCGALAGFACGLRYRITAPLAALGLVWTLSYRSSWGQVFHVEDLLVLHVIALACAPAADVWALAERREPAPAGYGWAIKLLVALTAATYLLAGIAKLRIAGFAWLDGDRLRDQIAVDNLRKALLGDGIGLFARPLLAHPASCAVLAIAALAIELAAPLALAGGRVAGVWICAAWAFHIGVLLTMNIVFPYALLGVAFLPVVPVERVIGAAREWPGWPSWFRNVLRPKLRL